MLSFDLSSFDWLFCIQILLICMVWFIILEVSDYFSQDRDFESLVRSKVIEERILKKTKE